MTTMGDPVRERAGGRSEKGAESAGCGGAETVQGRVFWSGGKVAENAARDFAEANGGTTLEKYDHLPHSYTRWSNHTPVSCVYYS